VAAAVDIKRLPSGEDVEYRPTASAMAIARQLDAAKRQVHFGAERGVALNLAPRLQLSPDGRGS
jgi:hypothetical protein